MGHLPFFFYVVNVNIVTEADSKFNHFSYKLFLYVLVHAKSPTATKGAAWDRSESNYFRYKNGVSHFFRESERCDQGKFPGASSMNPLFSLHPGLFSNIFVPF